MLRVPRLPLPTFVVGWLCIVGQTCGVTAAREPSDPFTSDPLVGKETQPYGAAVGAPSPETDSDASETAVPIEQPAAVTFVSASNVTSAAPAPTSKAAAAKKKKKKQEDLKKAVAGAYKPVFYDNNFAYVVAPLYTDWFPGDRLKRMRIGDFATVDVGGQYRTRYHSEHNIRGFGLTGVDDAFVLQRTRLFANVEAGERLRVYAEMIDAVSNFEDFAPRAIEENRADLLNLFADVVLLDADGGKLKFRGGRQELLYGSERLISPLDWANTRRTFEGYKLMWSGENWNVDGFYTLPVLVNRSQFDSPTYQQEFFGTFATYKGVKDQTFDLYWLTFNNSSPPNNFKYQTTGGRWLGTRESWLWELEGGMQFGDNTNGTDHWATFATAGVGRKNDEHAWKPALWCYYDYASGGSARGAGTGFNHLFPLAHKYLGFMDLFGRSNIESPNVLLTLQPHQKFKVLLWYYYFFLENKSDTPYNVNMTAFNGANTAGSRDLGHEIDAIFTYTINPRCDLLFGYSHFFAGEYYRTTPGLANQADGDFFYTQYQWNF